MVRRIAVAAVAAATAACGGHLDLSRPQCDPGAQTGCGAGLYCEPVGGGGSACFAPVLVRGTVADPTTVTTTLLAGARVVGLDASRAPVSSVGVTAAGGAYELKVRAARDAAGRPVASAITLRADAQGYQTFPGGVRPALPIDLSTAAQVGGSWVVSGPLTALQLLPLTGGGTARIEGTVPRVPTIAAPLVVAEPVGGGPGVTGIADRDGSYAIFNLAVGTPYVVKAYARGANYPAVTTAPLSAIQTTVSLAGPAPTGASVSGDLIFNRSANPDVDVTLVVESTYLTTLDRGESPPGLTVHGAGNGYAFTGVPDGTYVVLAAFGRDHDVRDVSGGGNTAAPRVTVASGVAATPDPFKVVPSVDLLTIGGTPVGVDPIVVVTGATPELTWSGFSSAGTYRVLVFDSFGNTMWSQDLAATSGEAVVYAGATLERGLAYQVRILAIHEAPPVPPSFQQLSQTEDVTGVFTYRP